MRLILVLRMRMLVVRDPAGCGDGKSRYSYACTLYLFFSCAYVSGVAFVYPYRHGGHSIFLFVAF